MTPSEGIVAPSGGRMAPSGEEVERFDGSEDEDEEMSQGDSY